MCKYSLLVNPKSFVFTLHQQTHNNISGCHTFLLRQFFLEYNISWDKHFLKYVGGGIWQLAKLLDLQNLARRRKAIKTTKDYGHYGNVYLPLALLKKGGGSQLMMFAWWSKLVGIGIIANRQKLVKNQAIAKKKSNITQKEYRVIGKKELLLEKKSDSKKRPCKKAAKKNKVLKWARGKKVRFPKNVEILSVKPSYMIFPQVIFLQYTMSHAGNQMPDIWQVAVM